MTGRKLTPQQIVVALSTLGLPGGVEMLLGPRGTFPLPPLPPEPVRPSLDDIVTSLGEAPKLPIIRSPERSGQRAQFVPHHVDRVKRSKAKAARKARKKNRR